MIRDVEEKQDDLKALCLKYNVAKMELFGSAATDEDFSMENSDLDFLVEFQPEQDLGPWMSHFTEFQEDLEKLFGRKVELIKNQEFHNPYFVEALNESRTVVYGGRSSG